jgi:hypothetical protein
VTGRCSGRSRDRTCDFVRVKELPGTPGDPPLQSSRDVAADGVTPEEASGPAQTPPCEKSMRKLPVAERSALLALARQIRSALPPGPSKLRDLVVELERRLEAAGAPAEADAG